MFWPRVEPVNPGGGTRGNCVQASGCGVSRTSSSTSSGGLSFRVTHRMQLSLGIVERGRQGFQRFKHTPAAGDVGVDLMREVARLIGGGRAVEPGAEFAEAGHQRTEFPTNFVGA